MLPQRIRSSGLTRELPFRRVKLLTLHTDSMPTCTRLALVFRYVMPRRTLAVVVVDTLFGRFLNFVDRIKR